jgi:aminopeptidase N
MRIDSPPTIYLKNYQPTPYAIEQVHLKFDLKPEKTVVTSHLHMMPRVSAPDAAPLIFDGEKIDLVSIAIDGVELLPEHYVVTPSTLTIAKVPQVAFTLHIVTHCAPLHNTELSGLYMSNGMYCTQCEAEGFRRITYFYDRPDVMAKFKVRIEAPLNMLTLLSNGNEILSGEFAGRRFSEWEDPHPKPSYLFALVAGNLAGVQDHFTTQSGRRIQLGIYVEKGKENRCAWAMEALKTSMRWDETAFGREYDLDVFNIVAVSDFNMGAMENKGLNIFNDKYILALPETATDTDYVLIEAIIAHEYFHNWTGNRITCRDWFQLCLKEGLTVFRDQEFTSDLRSRAVKRIQDVKTLRTRQMPEDAGPLQHAPRPSSYIEINNFYTPTVYEKGAEICRMMKTLIGPSDFRKAMDLYFERHDGHAATVEQFVACMAETSGRDLSQFFKWYVQSGTPKLRARGEFNSQTQSYNLTISQNVPRLKGQSKKTPLHIPLTVGLIDDSGRDLPLNLQGKGILKDGLIELTQTKYTFTFNTIAKRPVLSLNRGFTAPVILHSNATSAELLFLMGHDVDNFNRWEAAQTVSKNIIAKTYGAFLHNKTPPSSTKFAAALGASLQNPALDNAFKSLLLALPTEAEMAAHIGKNIDSDVLLKARAQVQCAIAQQLKPLLAHILANTHATTNYAPDPEGTARRQLRYSVLQLLGLVDVVEALRIAQADIKQADNLTAEMGAIGAILNHDIPERDVLLSDFYQRHKSDHLIVDKWFAMNAGITGVGTTQRVQNLLAHADFKYTTPNRVYALIGGFSSNQSAFNALDGLGYTLVADVIIALNAINPQVASRMATKFGSWRLFNAPRQNSAQAEMQRILATPKLSNDVFEIISRTLKN